MNAPKKPRRVRIGQCKNCGLLFQFQRRSSQDVAEDFNLQMCTHCYTINDGRMIPSQLGHREELPA